ncbi:Peptidoglycan/LPS O-acetylase OafA/YrhL, contains acyltransferase and SGNH-hydrolase domains [Fictibacillus solisalsi]|uniref:Peptidoglycan/LPS O-acetylase OafA/YrhL, contains acyltransferase and SGNH-hydrolase domains n=1 Tax=Fictibacillus solisalsi TaxID=459525 RepID=A0A1G9YF60_9BACL|nr:acyltransferase family protein [Fictibacillus solisalsi]SDN07692.1 Peptidoglycan/LPS O-acetylase OafA/YrhL, contains acyltransferase and SGNH-hydrolase domains [Fictibacillus solisalsi]
MGAERYKLQLVQSFRAIAIIIVMLGHANHMFYQRFQYDWFHISQWNRMGGVDFFFVVTGFMISYLYSTKAGSLTSAKQFLVKRWMRIYPLYFLFTVAAIAILFILPMQDESHKRDMAVIFKSLFLLPVDPVLTVTWSLQYIMVFYLVFAGFLIWPKLFKYILAGWAVILLSAQMGLIPGKNTFLLNFSNLEILAGCFISYLVLHVKFSSGLFWMLSGLAGYYLVWSNNLFHVVSIYEPYFYFFFSFMMMLGITIVDLKKQTKVPAFLSFLGDASYSIYIAHGPFIQFYLYVFIFINVPNIFGNFISLLLLLFCTVASCLLVYLFIERPLIRQVKRFLNTRPQIKKREYKISMHTIFSSMKEGDGLIGERVKKYRMKSKMSINQLAEKTGIAKSYLSSIEQNAKSNPSILILHKIAHTLKIPAYALMHPDTQDQIDDEWISLINKAIEIGLTKEQFEEYLEWERKKTLNPEF